MKRDKDLITRRTFLNRSVQAAMGSLAAPWMINLAAMGEAAAFSASDYKALVCVFFLGGNDYANTVVNFDDASYGKYLAIRGAGAGSNTSPVVMQKTDLAATELRPTVPLPGGRKYALHPDMTGLTSLFNSGKAAVQLNIGPLIVPLTRAQYKLQNFRDYPMPAKLFSHNDQQSTWQSFAPEGATLGWGGKIGDLAIGNNTDPLFTCISVTGNNIFLSGVAARQYQVSSTGSAVLVDAAMSTNSFFGTAEMRNAFTSMLQQPRTHVLENEYNLTMRNSMAAATRINTGFSSVNLTTAFPATSLGSQLRTVAQVIGARNTLGAKRQVFMVSLGGFDLHDYLGTRHAPLLQQVDQAMAAFYQATVALGVANQVTAFTASDFGRTLSINGDGSDHGWGSHHLVVGGAVQGAAFYGKPPPVSITDTSSPDDQWHVGQGRLLPSTSVDQFAATLARWFGVSDSELASLLPNLRNFGVAGGRPDYPANLGFLGGPII